MTEWIALFCPHCGGTVNEDDLLNDHDLTPGQVEEIRYKVTNRGSMYTCGWCKIRTNDWDHVIECRRAHTPARLKATHNKRALDLIRMLDEMDRKYGTSDPEEIAEIKAAFDVAWGRG